MTVVSVLSLIHISHITREEFDSETESLLQSTISGTKRALDIARGNGVNRIDEIILVGGSTYMPQVSVAVERELGITPISYDPDLSGVPIAPVPPNIKIFIAQILSFA